MIPKSLPIRLVCSFTMPAKSFMIEFMSRMSLCFMFLKRWISIYYKVIFLFKIWIITSICLIFVSLSLINSCRWSSSKLFLKHKKSRKSIIRSFIYKVSKLFVRCNFEIVTFASKDLRFHWRLRHNFHR